ncbi:MAG: hypothetical protein L3J69_02130 [Desulfobacula sp.]|nr:hypothetical protein [Desulfobacula sp.]
MNGEPGALFFPMDEEQAKSLYIKEIPLTDPVEIEGGTGVETGEMILKHAIRV